MAVATPQTRLPTEERQPEIVRAALQLAQVSSPPLITTQAIADAVGISQGAVYKHFATKEAIWLAAMQWVQAQLLADLQRAADACASPGAGLRAVFAAHVEFAVHHPGVPRILFHELQQPADSPVKQQVRNMLQSYRRLLLRLIDAALRGGELRDGLDEQAAATLFLGMVQGLVMQAMAAGKAGALKAPADGVWAIYWAGIQADPSAAGGRASSLSAAKASSTRTARRITA